MSMFVDNSIIFSGKIICNVNICREKICQIKKTGGTHIFPIFAGWSGEQGSFLLKRHGSIGIIDSYISIFMISLD